MDDDSKSIRHYFVDESGSGVLFDRRGNVLLDKQGVSKHFTLGALTVQDPSRLHLAFETLRADILRDPYFSKVPSISPEADKTARLFHAKDDIPEVRREVYRELQNHNLKFVSVVKSMNAVLRYVRERNKVDSHYRYHPNELYDFLVRLLFRNPLHKSDEIVVYFAIRGNSSRTEALRTSLQSAKKRFEAKTGIVNENTIRIHPNYADQSAGLQAVDYFLWALQRFFERHEDRYLTYLWPQISLVHDIDDKRMKEYGEYYTKKKPLTLAAIKNRRV